VLPLAAASGSAQPPHLCVGQPANVVGTEGPDTIDRSADSSRHDVIVAFGGHDTITVRADSVLICAGAGNDRVEVTDSSRFGLVIIQGGAGADVLETRGPGFALVSGGAGDDVLRGGPGLEEAVYERSPRGIDLSLRTGLAVGDGRDRLSGYERVHGTKFRDRLELGSRRGGLSGGPGDDLLLGGPGNDSLTAGNGRDTVRGFGGADQMQGAAGDDTLFGGAGRDRIEGGPGRDRIDGGPGRDRCVQGERTKRCP
jgi:Ca2+-binding RTX toxin-like protein